MTAHSAGTLAYLDDEIVMLTGHSQIWPYVIRDRRVVQQPTPYVEILHLESSGHWSMQPAAHLRIICTTDEGAPRRIWEGCLDLWDRALSPHFADCATHVTAADEGALPGDSGPHWVRL
jgi:hypothetical protein